MRIHTTLKPNPTRYTTRAIRVVFLELRRYHHYVITGLGLPRVFFTRGFYIHTIPAALNPRTTRHPRAKERLRGSIGVLAVHNYSRMNATRVDFVVDCYPKVSIKNSERKKRAFTESNVLKIYGKKQKTPTQWKKFLNNGENKESLAGFICRRMEGEQIRAF